MDAFWVTSSQDEHSAAANPEPLEALSYRAGTWPSTTSMASLIASDRAPCRKNPEAGVD